MAVRPIHRVRVAILGCAIGGSALPALAQVAAPQPSSPAAANSQDAARRKIMESDRWRRTQRDLNDWLATQRIYTPQEVASIKSEIKAKVARMSPLELEALMKEMEDRLAVLTGPEADDARVWVSQFLATARNGEQQLQNKRPDVMRMSASEIRQELMRFQQQRATTQQAQSAFSQGRALQVQSAQQVQANRTQAAEDAQRARSRAANGTPVVNRSQYAPRRDIVVPVRRPLIYDIGPWGTPVMWHPLNEPWFGG